MKRTKKPSRSAFVSAAGPETAVKPAQWFEGIISRAGLARTASDRKSEAFMHVVNAVVAMEETTPGIAAEYESGLQILEEVYGLSGLSSSAPGFETRRGRTIRKARARLLAANPARCA